MNRGEEVLLPTIELPAKEKHNDIDKDAFLKSQREEIENESRRVDVDIRREELEGKRQDREERKDFADKIYYLLIGFLVVVFSIIFLSGFDSIQFTMSDVILTTLLATSSANIIGIFIFVVKYLFKSNS